ncbi:IS1182 family transposase [Lacinutrix jangbogonensis]|uniref:IS1182 family transposase n=1 Tax=Lacinutrix jangbogonensis TaxID=1469557 RepID=UPI00068BFD79|nr:IS1182 family transposase [Lacinutrix jangbogonensis]
MSYIQGFNRKQAVLIPETIEQLIAENNPVRFIDAFVNSQDVVALGFKDIRFNKNGRPPFHPKDLLKLYIYGYLNKIRSSRALEKEYIRNVELMWLIKGLVPDHNTISNFRRDNPKSIKKVFRATVNIAKNLDLIGGVLLAGDGTKLRAQNSKKNNYNQKKIDRHIAYIETKLAQYCNALETADGDKKKVIETKIAKQNKHKKQYQAIEKQLKQTGEKQFSSSDPEARQLVIRGVVTEVCYNVQSTVDHKHKIPIDYDLTNNNDKHAMTSMVENAIEIVGNNTFDAVFDKGYYTAEQIHKSQKLGVTTHVCVPNPASNAPDKAYNVSEFIYNKVQDTYCCPAGETLKTNGNWYNKRVYRVKQYKTKNCKLCPVKNDCTKAKYQRIIERHEFAEALDINKNNISKNPEIYAQRQAIVEHPFGTMKRQWGFDHIMTKKTKERASADVGFIFIAYNLKRIMNSIGIDRLIKHIILFWLEIGIKKRLNKLLKSFEHLKKLTVYFIENASPKSTTKQIAYF